MTATVAVSEVAEVNPKLRTAPKPDDQIAFVGMADLDPVDAVATDVEQRPFSEVAKGYTPFEDGDVLLAKITPCFENMKIGQARTSTSVACGSTEFHVVRPYEDRLDRRYLLHFLRQPWVLELGELRMTGSAGQRRVPERFLDELSIPLPPLDEQRRIAAVLDAADALRVKRRQALDKLDDLVGALFVDLFGDVDNNDRGWPMHPVGEFVESFETGKSVAAGPDDTPGGYRVLKVSAVTSWRFEASESKPVPADYSPPARHVVRQGDLLMSRANTTELVGACALVREVPDRHLLPDKLWRFTWKDSLAVEPLYVWMVLQGRRARRLIGDLASGSSGSMKNISQQKFLTVELPIPPIDQQRLFVERLEAVARIEAEANRATARLNDLFGSLQQRAFRGEL